MGLQVTISTKYGIEIPTAYLKIGNISADKDGFYINLEIYATQTARDTGTPVLERRYFTVDTTEPQNVASLYTYLKTLPEFAGAVDC